MHRAIACSSACTKSSPNSLILDFWATTRCSCLRDQTQDYHTTTTSPPPPYHITSSPLTVISSSTHETEPRQPDFGFLGHNSPLPLARPNIGPPYHHYLAYLIASSPLTVVSSGAHETEPRRPDFGFWATTRRSHLRDQTQDHRTTTTSPPPPYHIASSPPTVVSSGAHKTEPQQLDFGLLGHNSPLPLARPNSGLPHHHYLAPTTLPHRLIALNSLFQRRARNRAATARGMHKTKPLVSDFWPLPPASRCLHTPQPTTSLHHPPLPFTMARTKLSPRGLVSDFWPSGSVLLLIIPFKPF